MTDQAEVRTLTQARRPWVVWSTILALGSAACLGVVLGYLRRGFDFTDEGYYLLGLRHPEDVTLALSSYHQVVANLLGMRNLGVVEYRLIGLAVIVASSAILGGAFAWAHSASDAHTKKRYVWYVLWAVLGGMLYFSWGPRGLSYNTVSAALCYLECATVLVCGGLVENDRLSWRAQTFGYLLLGLLLGMHLLVKATSAAAMGVIVALTTVWIARSSWRRWVAASVLGLVGCMIMPFWYFTQVAGIEQWVERVVAVKTAMSSFYSLQNLWLATVSVSLGAARRVVPFALMAGLVAFVGAKERARGHKVRAILLELLAVGCGMAVVALSAKLRGGEEETLRLWVPHVVLLVLLSAGLLGASGWRDVVERGNGIRSVILLGLPIASALGSTNIVTRQMLFAMASWFVLAGQAHVALTTRTQSALAWLAPTFAATSVIVQVARGQIVRPFGIHGAMGEQVVQLATDGGTAWPLLVDEVTSAFVKGVDQTLRRGGFEPGDVVWAVHDTPGLVYLIGGRAPETPWLLSGRETLGLTCLAMERTPIAQREFLVLSQPLDPIVDECMRRTGRARDSFSYLGKVSRPPLPITPSVAELRLLGRRHGT